MLVNGKLGRFLKELNKTLLLRVQVVMGPKRSRVSVSTKPRDILTPEMADRRGGPPSLDTNIFIYLVGISRDNSGQGHTIHAD